MPLDVNTILTDYESYFEEKVEDHTLKEAGKEAILHLRKNGSYLKREADSQARTLFVRLQALAEREGVDALVKKNKSLSLQVDTEKEMVKALAHANMKSVWIIHTPLIATPCVSVGKATPGLLAKEIEQNEQLKNLTLERSSIIRDHLAQGGKLIIAYNKDQPGRTHEQLAIYEVLKGEYPTQIVDFPMPLGGGNYPEDLIGATYLMEDAQGHWFEMTNRGLQANAPKEAEWGIWMQDKQKPVPAVAERIEKIIDFLEKHRIKEALEKSAHLEDFTPLTRHMRSAPSMRLVPSNK